MPNTMLAVWYRKTGENTYIVHKTMYRYVPMQNPTSEANTEMEIVFRGTRVFSVDQLPSKVKGRISIGENYLVQESYVAYLQAQSEVDIFDLDPNYFELVHDTDNSVCS